MALKNFKPTSPGLRQLVIVDRSELYKGAPEKSLTIGLTKSGGRDNFGHVTSRRIGGGHKRKLRIIDFKRNKFDAEATVERIEYDPNRSAFIALISYADGEKAYILAPQRLKAGDKIISADKADIKPGNAMPLKNMPVGTIIHNIELKAGKGGQLVRAAGNMAQLMEICRALSCSIQGRVNIYIEKTILAGDCHGAHSDRERDIAHHRIFYHSL